MNRVRTAFEQSVLWLHFCLETFRQSFDALDWLETFPRFSSASLLTVAVDLA